MQIKVDNDPESRGQRTQFLKRRVDFADRIGKPIYPKGITLTKQAMQAINTFAPQAFIA